MTRRFGIAVALQFALIILFFIGAGAQVPALSVLVVLIWTPASYWVGYTFQRAGGRFRSPIQFRTSVQK